MFVSRLCRVQTLRMLPSSSLLHSFCSSSPLFSRTLPSEPPKSFNGHLEISIYSHFVQGSLRNYASGRKNGKGGQKDGEDPFGNEKTRRSNNIKGEGSSVNDPWDFSGEGDSFSGLNEGKWDEFGSGEGDSNVDWNSIEPDEKFDPDSQGKGEQWEGFGDTGSIPFDGKVDGFGQDDWKGNQDGETGKEISWGEDTTTDWSTESPIDPPLGSGSSTEEGQGFESKKGGTDEWATVEGYQDWSIEEGVGAHEGVVGEDGVQGEIESDQAWGLQVKATEQATIEAESEMEKEEKQLKAVLEGPDRAFGDLIAASGITEVQIESLIAMKDLEGIEGLPPLKELEDARLERMERKSRRGEIERKRQEEIAASRVRQVDEKGRAYGTGRRKCSVARVWIQPGDGRFIVNDKSFDVYFPQLAHRADLLSPFVETKTLGLWDIVSTVKGGGVSGQVGAIRLGISRALQNWEPGLRSYLRSAGLLTRDPRMVERKKPGKAKARKSFQWVKR
eukprot:Gb_37974 [translate_table: standard]